MRIVSWNIKQGGGRRSATIAQALVNSSPDIVVLGEYMTGTSAPLLREISSLGWTHHAFATPPEGYGGVAVLSKHKLVPQAPPFGLEPFAFRYQAIELPALDLELRAIYAPLHADPYRDFWESALDALEGEVERPVLVVGDLNMGATGIDSPAPNVFCNRYFRELSTRGYSDLWRQFNGEEAREYTWQGPINPYRLDHAFGTTAISKRLLSCRYDHEVRESKLSDHSLLTIDLSDGIG